ncbi:MAG: hypothetical protein ACREH8_17580 [Opitutaceae bacterium]
MNILRISPALLAVAALAPGLGVAAGAEESAQTITFSDPSKPGTVKISLGRAELRVQGADTSEVAVKSDARAMTGKPRKDGMRVLSAASSFALTEQENVITLDAGKEWGARGSADFDLTVPRNTTIIVQNGWGGGITCTGINGDIEINSMQGEIKLVDVSGGIVVGTMNGRIHASIRELNEGKPLSFTSMNGEVVVRVPESARANVRLRTQNGTVLTDFEESALITKTEAAAGIPRGKSPFAGRILTAEIQDAIREATQLSATAIKEALEAIKEGFEAARLDSNDAHRQMEEAKRQMERARRDMEREKHDAERRATGRVDRGPKLPGPAAPEGPPAPDAAPPAPAAPKPKALPTITGGKLVTGTLNGGGPEISVSTMNGDVILRKLTD